ncbi:hypothetical protein [Photorhabdus laumondii]|nr:hypothetical protein [Photorhabdus laumondii]
MSKLQEMYISPASVWQAGGSINWDIFYQSEYRKRLPRQLIHLKERQSEL